MSGGVGFVEAQVVVATAPQTLEVLVEPVSVKLEVVVDSGIVKQAHPLEILEAGYVAAMYDGIV